MSNIYKLVIIVFLILIIFNKKIITYYYTKKLSKWIERPILYNKISIDYPNNIEIEGIKIKNTGNFFHNNIFESDLVKLSINLKSFFFSDLVIIDKLFIQEPKFFIDILKKKPNEKGDTANTIFDDNIGLAKKINEDLPDRIWPKKNKDINFLIVNTEIIKASAYINISSINQKTQTFLSDMKFREIGNEKNYRHYKDVLKLILYDIFARADNPKVKKLLKEIYNL